jgi:septum formation protein
LIPVILASTSAARAAILTGAGVAFTTAPPQVDEGIIKDEMSTRGATPREIAEALAEQKAVSVSRGRAGLVIGADQTLDLDGGLFDKAETVEEARERLRLLQGRAHTLQTAVVLARDGEPVWRLTDAPRLTMRRFTDEFLEGYLGRQGRTVLASVGCYQLEGEGAQLFEKVEGDYFSILGLPLWGLLAVLREKGALTR